MHSQTRRRRGPRRRRPTNEGLAQADPNQVWVGGDGTGKDGKEAAPSPETTLLNGRFAVTQTLGKGAFGEAVLARDRAQNDQQCVIKILRLSRVPKAARQRHYDVLINEVFVLDVLRPHCAQYVMCYQQSFYHGPEAYLVCEYLDGFVPLSKAATSAEDVRALAMVCSQLWQGMQAMHRAGVAHRDIKPDNVMIHPATRRIKYIDFGLACFCMDDTVSSLTRVMVGTPNYCDPALRIAKAAQLTLDFLVRCDRFSLGVVLFKLILGKFPYDYYHKGPRPRTAEDVINVNQTMSEWLPASTLAAERPVQEYAASQGWPYESVAALLRLQPQQPQQTPQQTTTRAPTPLRPPPAMPEMPRTLQLSKGSADARTKPTPVAAEKTDANPTGNPFHRTASTSPSQRADQQKAEQLKNELDRLMGSLPANT